MSLQITDGSNTLATATFFTAPVPTVTVGSEQSLELVFESVTDYEAVLDHLEVLGDEVVRRGTTDRGLPWFRERLPASATVDSLVVALEESSTSRYDHWALLVAGEDQSTANSDYYAVEIDVFVLADRSDYSTRSDVENALGDDRS